MAEKYKDRHFIKKAAAEAGVDIEKTEIIFRSIFKQISDEVMKGKTVQIGEFGSFKLKHLGRRVSVNVFDPQYEAVSKEHLKISFTAYADLNRRAERKLIRQKKKEEEEQAS